MPYAPCQRWGIWEVLPAQTMGQILDEERMHGITFSFTKKLWEELKGADPRTTGHWVLNPKVAGGKEWKSKSLVSREQWDIHQQTGGFPTLVWIIEGPHGGHSWHFGKLEQAVLLAANVDPEFVSAMQSLWPDPGSQPYAEFGQDVVQALQERDLLQRWVSNTPWTSRTLRSASGLVLDQEQGDFSKTIMERILKYIDHQVGEAVSDIPRKLLPSWSDFTPSEEARDEDQAIADLLEH